MVGEAHQNAKRTLAELRDLARGIHPVVLDKGLDTALRSVTDSSPIPARLDLVIAGRPSQGRSNAAIAAVLFITQKVVEKHVASIFDKLGLSPSENDNRRVLAAITYLES